MLFYIVNWNDRIQRYKIFLWRYTMLIALTGLYRIFRRMWHQPAFRALMFVEGLLLGVGTVYYHLIEGWNWLDSVYFCVVTLATVGYGDFSPTTPFGRLFAIFYILIGVAMLGVFIQLAGKTAMEELQERSTLINKAAEEIELEKNRLKR
jgi:hypothetical protein